MKNENKILLILDLDETLIHARQEALNEQAAFNVFDYHIYKRPFLDAFLEAVKDDFILAIWSSASDDYVEEIVKRIIPKSIDLAFVWGNSRCTYRRNFNLEDSGYNDDFKNHYHYIKPLKKLKRQGYKLSKILIVDDSPHKSKDNYGNAIYIKEFVGAAKDTELKLLAKYLKTLKNKENVRLIEKRNWQNSFQ